MQGRSSPQRHLLAREQPAAAGGAPLGVRWVAKRAGGEVGPCDNCHRWGPEDLGAGSARARRRARLALAGGGRAQGSP